VVELAEKHGIYLLLSLTNNWNPLPGVDGNDTATAAPEIRRRDVTPGTDNTLNRNVLSNDYGGMDTYVREFGVDKKHDEFYTNQTIIDLFKDYTTNIVTRYVHSPAVFGWEIANDPRCNSTLPSRAGCKTQTITKWHAHIAKHIKEKDPNHLVASGNHGFFCTDCKKIYPVPKVSPPKPKTSATPGDRRQLAAALTKKNLLKERVEKRKQTRQQMKRAGALEETGVRIRGRWAATPTRRQDTGLGFAFDGSQGVDSEDILGIPQIGFSSFQLFPDQIIYTSEDPNLDAFNNTIQAGIEWITKQAQAGAKYGKPVTMTGFGLVTQSNAPTFVPFNSSVPVFNGTDVNSTTTSPNTPTNQTTGVTDDQRDAAYKAWLQSGIKNGLNGMLQYQWGQSNLTASTGTTVSPDGIGTTPNAPAGNPTSSNQNATGQSPNDGYTTSGSGQDGVVSQLTDANQQIAADTP